MPESSTGFTLDATEVRVLGALIEKDATTPEYYPLSLNALINACNQKSNRDPVMKVEEGAVRDALEQLHDKGLAGPVSGADSRVTKYEHRIYDALKLSRREVAILCELLLRGPQTPGELRGRAQRMYAFDGLEDVVSTLDRLVQREPPLVRILPRQPGTKESRYSQLLAGDVPQSELPGNSSEVSFETDRIGLLENRVSELRAEVEKLKNAFEAFRQQLGG